MTKQREDTIIMEAWDSGSKSWLFSACKCKVFIHEGRTYKLFRTGVMAKALGRTVDSVQRWERDKNFPSPIFEIEGSSRFRYYSEDQVRMTSYMQRTILGSNPDKLRGPGLNMAGFFKAVQDNWFVVDFDPKDYDVEQIQTGKNDVSFDV